MSNKFGVLAVVIVVAGITSFATFKYLTIAHSPVTDIGKYIEENPAVIKIALEKAFKKEAQEAQKQQKQAVEKISATLGDDRESPILGNPDGKISLILFIDPLCGYCRKFHPVIMKAIKEIKDLKVIVKDYPIIGGAKSVEIVRMSLAANQQGKYEQFSNKVYDDSQDFSTDHLKKIAKEIGLDMNKFQKSLDNEKIIDHIKANLSLGQQLGVEGTPAFIVNKQLHAGYRDFEDLKNIILETRNG